jgi:hypothetical protein
MLELLLKKYEDERESKRIADEIAAKAQMEEIRKRDRHIPKDEGKLRVYLAKKLVTTDKQDLRQKFLIAQNREFEIAVKS